MLDNLKKRQVNTSRLFAKSQMDLFDMNNPLGYLPTPTVYKFLRAVDKIKVEKNTIFEFYKNFDMTQFGDFGRFVCKAPTLLSYLKTAIQYNHYFYTSSVIALEIDKETAVFSQQFLDISISGRDYAESIVGCAIFHVFKSILGRDWQPQKLCVPKHTVKQIEPLFPKGNYPIETTLSRFSIAFDKSLLSTPNPRFLDATYQTSQLQSFSDRVYLNLLNTNTNNILRLPHLASAYDVSVRTFIRLLAKENTSFSHLQSKAMCQKATNLLKTSDMPVNHISEMMGYRDSSNFIRAFKQQTSLTPQQYRKTILMVKS